MNKKYCFFTNDVELTSIVNNTLSEKTGEKVFREGMPRLLDIYEKYNVKSTFFYTADIAQKFPAIVRTAAELGHEIGSHGLTHEVDKSFDIMTFTQQKEHLTKSKSILEEISGQKVISFRAPALRVNEFTGPALEEAGFLIDSSVASQRFDVFMSFGSVKKFKWLFAPRLPYKVDRNNLSRRGGSNIVEIPLSALLLPYIGTTMRIFPKLTKQLRYILHFENCVNRKPINFLIHPNELIEEQKSQGVVQKRATNVINYLLKDYLRTKLKGRNLGENAIELYENEVAFFHEQNYEACTLRAYVEKEFKVL